MRGSEGFQGYPRNSASVFFHHKRIRAVATRSSTLKRKSLNRPLLLKVIESTAKLTSTLSTDGSDRSVRECILTERLDEVEHDAADVRVTLDAQLALDLEVCHVDVQLPGAVYLDPAGNHVVLVESCGWERTLRRILCVRAAARRLRGARWAGR